MLQCLAAKVTNMHDILSLSVRSKYRDSTAVVHPTVKSTNIFPATLLLQIYVPTGQSGPTMLRSHENAVGTNPTEHWTPLQSDLAVSIPGIESANQPCELKLERSHLWLKRIPQNYGAISSGYHEDITSSFTPCDIITGILPLQPV